ncbi:aminodeoxychorismate synthase component I [Amycolatopsis antarctica]|uniref:Aminodeoxychorismate synthase component I n=1 Tax=Amycolatopsis antarctica TaxID=1854586 RepID=A0A263D0E6_9PSEU|nr:anthranilate synthase component I family protein [Amycolatopsis antarctica]OZM71903.1 aminodeoxychorismate synthase component I [Amycolatopsis antarctica]
MTIEKLQSVPARPARRVHVETARLPAPYVDALAGYRALATRFGEDEVYLLESAAGPAGDRRHQFVGFGELLAVSVTREVVRIDGVPALREIVLGALEPMLDTTHGDHRLRASRDLWHVLRAVRAVFDSEGDASRFRFGFLGYFGYDAARYVEDLPYLIDTPSDMPDVQLVLHQGCVVTDLAAGTAELLVHHSADWPRLDPATVRALLADAVPATGPDAGPLPPSSVSDDIDEDSYRAVVDRCMRHIRVGDVYQVQIGHELTVTSEIEPVRVYQRLRERNPSPYMYLTSINGSTVVGASPELFVRVEDGTVVMRPIAGTIARDGADDEAAARRLREDPKEIAEHTMLVDLCRNDIGRICERDTLDVPDYLDVERYSHLLHLVSTVEGQVAEGADSFDVIAALFPAGTMTGAPKIRAMEIIEEQESSRRGLYAGTLGLIDVGGYLNLALCIRTLMHRDGRYTTRASAGIVADSEPGREWAETLTKSGAAYWAVTGRELR